MSQLQESLLWLALTFIVGYGLAAVFDLLLRRFLTGAHRIVFPAVAAFLLIVMLMFNLVPVGTVRTDSYLWAMFSTFVSMLLVIAARNWRLSRLQRHEDASDSHEA